MGWDYCEDWRTRADVVKVLRGGWRDALTDSTLTYEAGMAVWWGTVAAEGQTFVVCALLERAGRMWGYKLMSEDMGPLYWSCPVRFLDSTTGLDNATARAWRAEVRRRAALR